MIIESETATGAGSRSRWASSRLGVRLAAEASRGAGCKQNLHALRPARRSVSAAIVHCDQPLDVICPCIADDLV